MESSKDETHKKKNRKDAPHNDQGADHGLQLSRGWPPQGSWWEHGEHEGTSIGVLGSQNNISKATWAQKKHGLEKHWKKWCLGNPFLESLTGNINNAKKLIQRPFIAFQLVLNFRQFQKRGFKWFQQGSHVSTKPAATKLAFESN